MLENIRIYQQYEFFSFPAKFLEVKTYTCEYQYVKTIYWKCSDELYIYIYIYIYILGKKHQKLPLGSFGNGQ